MWRDKVQTVSGDTSSQYNLRQTQATGSTHTQSGLRHEMASYTINFDNVRANKLVP